MGLQLEGFDFSDNPETMPIEVQGPGERGFQGGVYWGRCSRARALPHYKWRADTFKRVAETGPRLANAVGKGRLSLTDFLPEVEK